MAGAAQAGSEKDGSSLFRRAVFAFLLLIVAAGLAFFFLRDRMGSAPPAGGPQIAETPTAETAAAGTPAAEGPTTGSPAAGSPSSDPSSAGASSVGQEPGEESSAGAFEPPAGEAGTEPPASDPPSAAAAEAPPSAGAEATPSGAETAGEDPAVTPWPEDPSATTQPDPAPSVVETDPAVLAREVEELVSSWAAAWSAQNPDDYLACYAPTYTKPGLSRSQWEQQRRERLRAPASILVLAKNIKVEILDATRAKAVFYQDYETDTKHLYTWKTMELSRLPEGWRIVSERSGR